MKDILDIIYSLERIRLKNKGRMLQAYNTLIGSRVKVGIEFEFSGSVSQKTIARFIQLVESHNLFHKYVLEHNMGHDGRSWSAGRHTLEQDINREYRICFHVKRGWGWCYLLDYILSCFISLSMQVGSIHVHYNMESTIDGDIAPLVGRVVYWGKRTKKRIQEYRHILHSKIDKTAEKLYGDHSFSTRRFRYREHVPTIEIRIITPTVFYQQLMFEILYWEQCIKETQDEFRRTLKKDLIHRKYLEYSSQMEEELGCSNLLRGPLLQTYNFDSEGRTVLEEEEKDSLCLVCNISFTRPRSDASYLCPACLEGLEEAVEGFIVCPVT